MSSSSDTSPPAGENPRRHAAAAISPWRGSGAVPLTLLVAALVVGMAWLEVRLSSERDPAISIQVGGAQSESDENPDGPALPAAISRDGDLLAVIDGLAAALDDGRLAIADLERHPDFVALADPVRRLSARSILANRLLRDDRYPDALALIEPLPRAVRERYQMLFAYARSLGETGQPERAVEQYRRLLEIEPAHQGAAINLGLLLLQADEHAAARDVFAAAIDFSSGPRKAKAYAGLADAQVGLAEYAAAVANYRKSIEYRPDHALTWRKLARAFLLDGERFAEAADSYAKAAGLDPENSALRDEHADFLFASLEFGRAAKLLRQLLARSNQPDNVRLRLAVVNVELERPVRAAKLLAELQRKNLDSGERKVVDGLAHYLAQRYRDGLDTLKSSLKKNRDNNLAYYLVGVTYLALDKPKNALVYLQKVDPANPYFNAAQLRSAVARVAIGDSDSALALLDRLFRRVSGNDRIAYQVARLGYEEGNTRVARKAIEYALLRVPEEKKYQLLLAKIDWRADRSGQAISQLQAILERHPRYTPALYRLADYLEKQGQAQRARDVFARLIDVRREYSDALYRLARLRFDEPDAEGVEDLLVEYLENRGDDVDARVLLARHHCRMQRLAPCNEQIELVFKFAPRHPAAVEMRRQYFGRNQTTSGARIRLTPIWESHAKS